ncbi:ABC transporter [Sporosarcina sp. P37]|uniref:ABC transporter ATP-binding protein n=1 Tax=unclassified Sporosarcina TaxID=2647733 RepID=UPI000A17DA4B|nr:MULTISPECIES: ABC transporter ATP-binding protein [unclassified Sporosarcina]ARK24438.1 ABC transporter [Sporosarcina sp. P37]PID17604.1 ABC transporter [Sporosarcina sp. P35]
MSNISVSDLRLKFPGEESLVFRDLSFSVQPGEKVLMLGPSGCGKSTLLQVLSGIIPNSIELPMKSKAISLPDSWGFVFQDPDTQFCMTYVDEELAFVLENLQVPREQMKTLIEQVLKRVDLQLEDPHTAINELSQGMKQRLALASVLLLEPDVLFLDEPSALLDPEGTQQIWSSIKEATAEKTVLIVEHKIDLIADWVDRVVLFNDHGVILADGSPADIFSGYQEELTRYGIWYPGVWEKYKESEAFLSLMQNRSQVKPQEKILLQDFHGYRGAIQKISVEDATVQEGDWIAIVGENGSGKSTLLLSLMQLLRTDGIYEVNGVPIVQKKKKRQLPEGLSLVFQNPELQFVTNSIAEELTVSLHGMTKEDAASCARNLIDLFNLPGTASRHPYQLSTGQKRRLSVATALTPKTDIVLLDEPTFGQDARNTFAILEKLEKLRTEGITILMVTHDMEIVENFATSVWTVENGVLNPPAVTGGLLNA